MNRRSTLVAVASVLAVLGASARIAPSAAVPDDNWPQFRGLQAGVAADDPALPDTWSATEHIVWKTDVPGLGWSSPVVWGDHVFVTTAINTGEPEPPRRAATYSGRYLGGPVT